MTTDSHTTSAPAWMWIVAGLTFGLGVPAALYFLAGDATRAERVAEIREMSRTERNHLVRNEEKFRELPSNTQDAYRELHTALVASDPESQRLQAIADAYSAWLGDLAFSDWDRVLDEHDPAARAVIVSEVAAERVEARQAVEAIVTAETTNPTANRTGPRMPLVSRSDIAVIFDRLEQELPTDRKLRLPPKGLQRQIGVLKELASASASARGGRFRISDETVDAIAELVDIDFLKEPSRSLPEEFRKLGLARVIVTSMLVHLGEDNAPTEDELRDYFWSLPEERRTRLTEMEDHKAAKRFLTYGYLEARGGGQAAVWRELKGILDRMTPRVGGGRDGRDGRWNGPGGRRPGERDPNRDNERPRPPFPGPKPPN